MGFFNDSRKTPAESTPAEGEKPAENQTPPELSQQNSSEKLYPPPSPSFPPSGGQTPYTLSGSGRPSFSGSVRSSYIEDIKHEMMVNYLFHQQCSRLWIADGKGELEGVLLRKTRGNYNACPANLANSPFAYYCAQMNVQVKCMFHLEKKNHLNSNFGKTGCDDCKLTNYQDLPTMVTRRDRCTT
jgi:hypothetical protein